MRHSLVHISAAVGVAAAGLLAASPALAGAGHARTDSALVIYDPATPQDATAKVTAVYNAAGRSKIVLHVKGLLPNTSYGAHAHTNRCGVDGAAAGPHYQYNLAPAGMSADPAYANPTNEIWLDLTTNAAGNGVAKATVPWHFPADRRAMSVIIHRDLTSTAPGTAGMAGPRLACLNVTF